MFKYLNADLLNSFGTGFLTTVHTNTGELYDKAAKELGSDAMLSSSVVAMDRSGTSGPVKVLINTPSGYKLILAKKVVSTVPPKVDNLNGYDLSTKEQSLFSQFFNNGYYTGILQNTGLPDNISFDNPGPMISSESIADLRDRSAQSYKPGLYTISGNQAADLFQVFYGTPDVLTDDQVKTDIVASVQRLQKARGIPTTIPRFVAFSSHTPFNLMVPNEAIEDKFYEKLYSLQGERNTFYNGAAFHVQDSSVLWRFTEALLPRIVAAL